MASKLTVDIGKLTHNARVLRGICDEHGVEIHAVTKVIGSAPAVVSALIETGISTVGDSRIENLEKLDGLGCDRLLIRSPLMSEADRVVRTADISVNTEIAALRALEDACARQGVDQHRVLLMCDLGDLREGFVDHDELMQAAQYVCESEHLVLEGIGANLNCLSFIIPDAEKMQELADLAQQVRERFGVEHLTVSGGNSSSIKMMLEEGLGEGVNSLRLGECLFLGRERCGYDYLEGMYNDAFVFHAEVIECKEKPSKPWGTSGVDSYGRKHEFEDIGPRVRALVAFGHQDCDAEVMWPLDEGIRVVDSSSDHTVLDVTDANGTYEVGDTIAFRCGYHAIARAFCSPYVQVEFLR